jgi:hypothetical protein
MKIILFKIIISLLFSIVTFSGCNNNTKSNKDIYKYRLTTAGFNVWKYTDLIIEKGNCINFISNNDTNTTFCGTYQIEYLKGNNNGK